MGGAQARRPVALVLEGPLPVQGTRYQSTKQPDALTVSRNIPHETAQGELIRGGEVKTDLLALPTAVPI
jgi:hypothetical protein